MLKNTPPNTSSHWWNFFKNVFTRSCILDKGLQLLSKRALDKIITKRIFKHPLKKPMILKTFFLHAYESNRVWFQNSKEETWKFSLGQKPNMEIERQCQQDRIWKDFCASPMYDDGLFAKRYRTKWTLLLRILDNVCAHDSYFCKSKMHLAT
jgi:hypothetical protein